MGASCYGWAIVGTLMIAKPRQRAYRLGPLALRAQLFENARLASRRRAAQVVTDKTAVIFSLWDWVFGTAYLPADREGRLGWDLPTSGTFRARLLRRFLYPFWK